MEEHITDLKKCTRAGQLSRMNTPELMKAFQGANKEITYEALHELHKIRLGSPPDIDGNALADDILFHHHRDWDEIVAWSHEPNAPIRHVTTGVPQVDVIYLRSTKYGESGLIHLAIKWNRRYSTQIHVNHHSYLVLMLNEPLPPKPVK